jgi:hypothetical protein
MGFIDKFQQIRKRIGEVRRSRLSSFQHSHAHLLWELGLALRGTLRARKGCVLASLST